MKGVKKEGRTEVKKEGRNERKTCVSNGSNQSVVGNSESDKRVDVVSTLGWLVGLPWAFHVNQKFLISFRKVINIKNLLITFECGSTFELRLAFSLLPDFFWMHQN